MSSTDGSISKSEGDPMRLRQALLHWAVCAVVLAVIWPMAMNYSLRSGPSTTTAFWLVGIYWVGAGIYLNRAVLRRLVEWHPTYNTIGNVAAGKLKYLLLWPFMYPFLFVQLLIQKFL